jgi:hypothetical protein
MFTVGKYKCYFKHFQDEWGYLLTGRDDDNPYTQYKGKTSCYVDDIESGELLLEGEAYCSENDIFDKAVGRKISLARAIESLDKETRTEFWNKYIETTKRL